MRAVIQRVKNAWITVNSGEKQGMGAGLVVLFGVREGDDPRDTLAVANKISQLRIFEDSDGKMNVGPLELGMDCMVVSQFTLFADTKKGRRPSFVKAAKPDVAIPIYEKFLAEVQSMGFNKVVHGEFGAYIQINHTNDKPDTNIIDTEDWSGN